MEEATNYANSNHLQYIETSAKTGINIEEAYILAAQKILDKIEKGVIDVLNDKYGVKPGLQNGKTYHDLSSKEKSNEGSHCC